MKKAIVSIPMNDKTIEEIKAARLDAIEWITEQGYEFLETLYEGEIPTNHNPALFLFSHVCKVMSQADIVVFTGGWNCARGCQQEYSICRAYGIESTVFYGKGL